MLSVIAGELDGVDVDVAETDGVGVCEHRRMSVCVEAIVSTWLAIVTLFSSRTLSVELMARESQPPPLQHVPVMNARFLKTTLATCCGAPRSTDQNSEVDEPAES